MLLLGMPIGVWLPWFIAFGALIFTWWLGVVYWGKELKTGEYDKSES